MNLYELPRPGLLSAAKAEAQNMKHVNKPIRQSALFFIAYLLFVTYTVSSCCGEIMGLFLPIFNVPILVLYPFCGKMQSLWANLP
jgi:hypothetical protein